MMDNLRNVRGALPGLALVALALTGCGGGGGDAAAPAATGSSAEGVYGGTLTGSRNSDFQMVVLENNEVWALYGTQTSSQFLVTGFMQGSGSSSNGAYTSSDVRDFGFTPAVAGTANASYNASAKTVSGSIVAAGATVGFTGGPIPGSLYDYGAAATLSSITGAWSLAALTGETVALNVSSSGAFTATFSSGCTASGSLAPRPSGKNVFNLSLTFGSAPCLLPGQTASGIALSYPLANGRRQLILAGTAAARTIGTAAFGTR